MARVKVMVYGATGMLGSAVMAEVVRSGYDAIVGRARIHDFQDVARERQKGVPDAIINCAGAIPLRGCPGNDMVSVNAYGPHILAVMFNCHIVHVSTDCVFSGRDVRPYTTDDLPDPKDLYGRSKLAGELVDYPHTTTVRTSFVGKQHGLVKWFLEQRGEIEGWEHALWTGSTATEIARWLVPLSLGDPQRLIHLAAPVISKYEVLMLLQQAFGHTNVTIKRTPGQRIFRNLLPSPGYEMPLFEDVVWELVR